MTEVFRRPLLASCIILTTLTGLALIGIGIASFVANTKLFGIGVAAMLCGYGALLILVAGLVLKGHPWALNLIVAAALLHLLVVGSFLTTQNRDQFVGALIVAPFIVATLITAVLAVGRRELERLGH